MNGDVEISAPQGQNCVNVETNFSSGESAPATIAAPTPAAQRVKAGSHVPEAGCWTSLSLVTGDVTQAMTLPCIYVITAPTSRVPTRRHAGQ